MEMFTAWNGVTIRTEGLRLVLAGADKEHGWLTLQGALAVLAWDEACTTQEEQRAPTGHPARAALEFIAQTKSANEDMGAITWRGDEVMELLETIEKELRGEA